jgi:enoyl-CoA hydratase/carnithine racemase
LTVQRVRVSAQPWGTRVELCRPERRNALDQQAVAELREAFAADGSGAILLTAEGPTFCAGGDLRMLQRSASAGDLVEMMTTNAAAFADVIEAIVRCPRPVVAAIDGPAVGGGASLALACDLRIATPQARLSFAWARYGLPPDGCITATLAAIVGDVAESLLAEGADVTADSDAAPQIFRRIVPVELLEAESLAAVARAAKREDAAELLAEIRRHRDGELAAIARAAADKATSERLAMLYKIDR